MIRLAAVLLLIATAAYGHSWYPAECCGGNDCDRLDEDRVQIVQGGYVLDGKYFIAEANARVSQDGEYHACFWPTPDKLHCFFRPSMGS